ncbi:MAG TPA: T9SS type A sorting domain-containing protein [Candidatus Syntrophosphaera sp.]|nr:T9SS type A sorting domain-containing protein [Candidatus Syntrophosphaera sp.]
MKNMLFTGLFLLLAIVLSAQNGPQWLWADQAGSTGYDYGYAIDTNGNGTCYVAGWFSGTANFGGFSLTSVGGDDVFVGKLDSDGQWLWVVRGGGIYSDSACGISVAPDGSCFVSGNFSDVGTFGTSVLTSVGQQDVFVAKISSDGAWLWAKRTGGAQADTGFDVASDANGNCYVTGEFWNTADFGATSLTAFGQTDAFIAKLDGEGNWLWARQAGGTEYERSYGIASDSAGNCYVIGYFAGTGAFGATQLSSVGMSDVYVVKLDPDGTWLWATRGGGTASEQGCDICVDSAGNAYVAGLFNGSADCGGHVIISSGNCDAFAAKLDTGGNWLWADGAGGTGFDMGYGISCDAAGNSYTTGKFEASALFGTETLTSSGGSDIFICKLDPSGSALGAVRGGGTHTDEGEGICCDAGGNCYATGYFGIAGDFGPFNLTSFGGDDIYVAKISSGPVEAEDNLAPGLAGLSFLYDAWPDPLPAGGTAFIKVKLANREHGALRIFNLRGELIRTYPLEPGIQQLSFDNCGLPSGLYFYQLKTNTADIVKKLALVK